jgi:hypothetical protein
MASSLWHHASDSFTGDYLRIRKQRRLLIFRLPWRSCSQPRGLLGILAFFFDRPCAIEFTPFAQLISFTLARNVSAYQKQMPRPQADVQITNPAEAGFVG